MRRGTAGRRRARSSRRARSRRARRRRGSRATPRTGIGVATKGTGERIAQRRLSRDCALATQVPRVANCYDRACRSRSRSSINASAIWPATRARILDAVARAPARRRRAGRHARALALRLSARGPACCGRRSSTPARASSRRSPPQVGADVGRSSAFPSAATASPLQRRRGAARRPRRRRSTASRCCRTTRCSTRSATSRRARDALRVRRRRHARRASSSARTSGSRSRRRRRARPARRCSSCRTARRITRGSRRCGASRSPRARARTRLPIVYVNRVGGQDELVFDGASFVVDAQGALAQQLPAWHEAIALVDFDGARAAAGARRARSARSSRTCTRRWSWACATTSTRTAFPACSLGLSGGVDSALTLAVAVDALGPRPRARGDAAVAVQRADQPRRCARDGGHRRRALRRDRRSSRCSTRSSTALARRVSRACPPDAAEENIQARIRGTLLMALSNKHGSIVLTTGNKSEMAVGYATLYGDMAGGFAVLKDITKTLVYRLCALSQPAGPRDSRSAILTRAPSAELRAGPDRPGLAAAVRRARRASSRRTSSRTGARREIVAAGLSGRRR